MKPAIRNKIIEMISEGHLYKDIAKKYKVATNTVRRISLENGMRRNERYDSTEMEKTIENIYSDINNGLPYSDLNIKYDLNNKKKSNLYRYGLKPISKIYKERRDNTIKQLYKVKVAREVIKDEDKNLDSPERIETIHHVYTINRETGGQKKFPSVGSRYHGGNFEDKNILRYIQEKRDKHKWSFKRISDKLNELGKKTITGVPFASYLVRYKYYHYKKVKGKRLVK